MIAKSSSRVTSNTEEELNKMIWRKAERSIAYYALHPDEIDERLEELDREWDIERVLETLSSSLSIFGLAMALLRSRRWLALPITVQGFFMQHAVQGWCPPLPLLRRLGIRTPREIEMERAALKTLRGDFAEVAKVLESGPNGKIAQIMDAVA